MNDKPVATSLASKWAPIVAGAATAGIAVGQAGERFGLGAAAALGLLAGLAVAGAVYALLKMLRSRR